APKGFKYHRRCQWGCGGGVMYPMRSCPWCGRPQKWRYQEFQNICPHCNKGVNDWMYRVLLRPGVSGVTHRTPKIIEIERRYVTSKRRRRDDISWNMLSGL